MSKKKKTTRVWHEKNIYLEAQYKQSFTVVLPVYTEVREVVVLNTECCYMSVFTSDYDGVRDADVGWNKYSMPQLL